MLKAGVSNSKQDDVSASNGPIVGTARWKTSSTQKSSQVLDTTMQVTTPENISFHYQLAGPFRRILAYFLDVVITLVAYTIICTIIYFCLAILAIPFAYFGAVEVITAISQILRGLQQIGWFILYWFYGAYMEAQYNGQTLGKRITKMRVIATDGHAIDGVQATLRNFFRLLDVMPLVSIGALFMIEPTDTSFDAVLYRPLIPTCLFGLVVMTLNRKYQRVGDLVGNTVVISEEITRLPNLASFMDERVAQLAELIPASFVVPATMAKAIAEYVDRRKFLPFQRASEIASHLATPLLEKFGIPPDTDHDLFLCALYHKTFSSVQLEADQAVPMPGQTMNQEPGQQSGTINFWQQTAVPASISSQSDQNENQSDQNEKGFQMDPNDFRINP